jgi:hypothetical protein
MTTKTPTGHERMLLDATVEEEEQMADNVKENIAQVFNDLSSLHCNRFGNHRLEIRRG